MATIPTDANFTQQWHLRNTADAEFDLNVVDAWDDFTGRGVRLVVIDSGLDYAHSDLAPNYDTDADHDYGQNDDDAAPVGSGSAEHHGTAVAGIAAAAANGTGVVGVAYEATLIGYRIDYYSGSYATQVGTAIRDAADNGGDTVNMSLGVGGYFETSADVLGVVESIHYAVDNGRGGLGTILVMAGGNTRQYSYEGQINGRNFDSQTEMICVAAVDRDGTVSSYSSYGANNLVSAFGSPGQIVTTDRVGSAGYNGTDFTSSFNGTSAAAPQVTGITALMLEANSDLGWRDVQTILAYSARHVGSPVDGETTDGIERYPWAFNGADNWNGGGLHYSQDYGYGLVDARAAVRLAETWGEKSTSSNEKRVVADLLDDPTGIPDGDSDGITFRARVGKNIEIERVGLDVDFLGRANHLTIYLKGPDGEERELVTQAGTSGSTSQIEFEFESQQYRGMDSAGKWSVRIVDGFAGSPASFDDLKLRFYGSEITNDDTYVYTDEFADFLDSHSADLKDRNGGQDILNASPVTGDMMVDLGKGKGRIDGEAMRIAGVEHVYAGDGNDRITGNSAGNDLSGGRGMDTLRGGKGRDDFLFWAARDSLDGSADTIVDFASGDDIDVRHVDAIGGTRANEKFDFIGTRDLDGTAGQLNYRRSKADNATYVTGDIDGDGDADFVIELKGLHELKAADFVL